MMNECCEAAKRYLAAGLSVIPVTQDKSGHWKQPAVDWKEFQQRLASNEEVDAWWEKFPDARVGIVTGKISGIAVVDIDPRHGGSLSSVHLPPTLTVTTGGGGWHYFYRCPDDREVKSAVKVVPGVDIRAEGGMVVAPPSVHHSGDAYEWSQDFDRDLLADCPEWVWKTKAKAGLRLEDVIGGVAEGGRNEAAAVVCGSLLARTSPDEWETKTWPLVQRWNEKNAPPLSMDELRAVFEKIKARDFGKRFSRTNGDSTGEDNPNFSYVNLLIKALKQEENIALYFDEETERAFVRYTRNGVNELQPVLSKVFQGYAGEVARSRLGKNLRAQQLREATDSLDLEAHNGGIKVKSALRLRRDGGVIRYDLANNERQIVTVSADGWSVGNTDEFLFRRYGFTLSQPVPEHEGDIEPLFRIVKTYSEEERLLLICYLVSCFVPDIQHPILQVTGPKGSSKSTFTDIIRSLVDPSRLYHSSLSQTEDGIGLMASQNWMLVFDNVDMIKSHISDLLCRLCTGDAIGKRRFFTNDEMMVQSYRRCVVLNGINPLTRRTDLADRALWFRLRPIRSEDRRAESEIMEEFEANRAKILGGIFTLLSKAMRSIRSVDRTNLHRLADFDVWGRAIARAAGYDVEQFIVALQNNRCALNYESIRQSPVATTVIDLMADRSEWSGTPTELYEALKKAATLRRYDVRTGAWPQSAGALSFKLNEVEVELTDLGIRFTHTHTGKGGRRVNLYRDAIRETTEGAS